MADMQRIKASFVGIQGNQDLMTIQVGDMKWTIRSQVFTGKFGFFKKAINGGFKEGKEKFVELKEDGAIEVARMLFFVIYGRYPVSFAEHVQDIDGDNMPSIKDFFVLGREAANEEPFTEIEFQTIEDKEDNDDCYAEKAHAKMLVLANKYNFKDLESAVLKSLVHESRPASFSALYEFFESEGRLEEDNVNNLLTKIALKYVDQLFETEEFEQWR